MPIEDVKYIALVELKTGKRVCVLTNTDGIDVVKQHISWWPAFVKIHAIKALERLEEVDEWTEKLKSDPGYVAADAIFPDNSARAMSETGDE